MRLVLVGSVIALGLATVAGLVWLWPPENDQRRSLLESTYPGGVIVRATVVGVLEQTCPGLSDDRLPDGTIPATVTCGTVRARPDGAGSDDVVTVQVAAEVLQAGIGVGDSVDLVHIPDSAGLGPRAYAWVDFHRQAPLAVLAAGYVILVLAVGRLRGLAAMAGMGLAGLTIVVFVLPALRAGENGIAVGLVASSALMIVILYLAHGVSARTTTALIGTMAGLAVTAGLTAWAGAAAHLNGLSTEDDFVLSKLTTGGGLADLTTCGIILAGLGVLNDVTVAQASAVWELRAQAPQLSRGQLFTSGMRIGRDHLASTVYTIMFVYAGAALPTLMLLELYAQPLGLVLSSGQIAEEVVRTLVGMIGLVTAIPLTTAIAVVVADGAEVSSAG